MSFIPALNKAILRAFGEPITYTPKSTGIPVTTVAIPRTPEVEQSIAPGYIMDVEIDPLVIASPARHDEITWADGTLYVVGKVSRPDPLSLIVLALHRKLDI